MEYGVVISHYYEERRDNLDKIMKEANQWKNNGPVVVWNNSPDTVTGPVRVEVVNSPVNSMIGRYLVPLLYPATEYWLFQDDDVMVTEDTAQTLISNAMKWNGIWIGVEGRNVAALSPTPYKDAMGVRVARDDREIKAADIVLRVMAGHRTCVLEGLERVLMLGRDPGRCEDMVMTFGRAAVCGGVDWINLPEGGVGMCLDPEHVEERDGMIKQLISEGVMWRRR
jgi:hypothetical protein